ncbi:MAG TPA: riboflavin synthase [Flavisolibacter sp.]|jgi:riboflavin synthase|nr:riboflavin synthase [Flavisolibacter sp.]
MFTGIVESFGTVKEVISEGTNKTFWIESALSDSFTIDQSIAHDGVCLTVEAVENGCHRVTAVAETLEKTNLNQWKQGTVVNLERSLVANQRVDGHFVQGHVDTTGSIIRSKNKKGSWEYQFRFPKKFAPLIIEKGSICVNGISLTAFGVKKDRFSVAVIPYTYEHTNLKFLNEADTVNLEFDLLGKYILRKLSLD